MTDTFDPVRHDRLNATLGGSHPTRRRLLVAGAAALALPRTSRAAPAMSLKIGYLYSKDSQLGAGALAFADEVATRTGGRYAIDQYPNAALGGELEMLEALRSGEIDLAFITGAPITSVIPEHGIFDIPFLFRDATHAHAVLDSPIGRGYLEMFGRKQVVALAWGENGMRHLTNSLRPVHSPKDIQGLRLRVPQSEIMVKSFEALGAHAEQLAFPALYGALEAGRFDGQENPIATIESAKFARVQKHLTLTGHVYSTAVVLMSQDAWKDLVETDKPAFVEAARIGGIASRRFAGKAEQEGVQRLAKEGMQVITEIDRDTFVAALAPVTQEFARRFGSDVIERIRAVQAA